MSHPDSLSIRPYRPPDEPAIRGICFATGCLGASPADRWLDVNEALFTDFWLEYYFRREPESIWVAEAGGRVIAYVTGCRDTRAKARYMKGPFLRHFLRSLLRGRYRLGRRTLRLGGLLALDAVTAGFPRLPVKECPAHVHYNLLPEFRGGCRSFGMRLSSRFFQALMDAGISKCHGLVVLPERNLGRSYRTLGRIYDQRETRAFRGVTREKHFMVSFAFDLPEIVRRYPQYFAGSARPAAAGAARDKEGDE